jgi:hypothetical protein
LLKGQAEAISQVGLTEFEHQPPHADAAADLLVDQDGRLLSPPMHRMLIRPRFNDDGQADYFGINHPFGDLTASDMRVEPAGAQVNRKLGPDDPPIGG